MGNPEEFSDTAAWFSNLGSSSSPEEILASTFEKAKTSLRATLKSEDFDRLFPPGSGVAVCSFADVQLDLYQAQKVYEQRTGTAEDPFQKIPSGSGGNVSAVHPPKSLGTVSNNASGGVVSPASSFPWPSSYSIAANSKHVAAQTTKAPSSPSVKARQWLTSLSERLVHYQNVFDVLVQHHPQYVALAWGLLKLLFLGIINNAETASKLAKALSLVADLLPSSAFNLILYPTDEMQHAVSRLFARVLHFQCGALRWYNASRAKHAVSAFFNPWDRAFKSHLAAIAEASEGVESLAGCGAKAEIRYMRMEITRITQHCQTLGSETQNLREENKQLREDNKQLICLAETNETQLEKINDALTCMSREIKANFSGQRDQLNRMHLAHMIALPIWGTWPTAGASLQFCRAICNRNRVRPALPAADRARLEAWSEQRPSSSSSPPSPPLLLIDTCKPRAAKSFMVSLIDLVRAHGRPMLWALRFADYRDRRITPTDLVRMLALQAAQAGGERLLTGTFPVTIEALCEAASLREWVAILDRLLAACSPGVFVALDPELLAFARACERCEAQDFLKLLKSGLSGHCKIITASSGIGRAYGQELQHESACVKILSDEANGWRTNQRAKKRPLRLRR